MATITLAVCAVALAGLMLLERREHALTVSELIDAHQVTVESLAARAVTEADVARAQHADTVTALTAAITAERTAFIEQVDRLCQRIQAPEQAVVDHAVQVQQPSPAAVPPDDDQGYWAAQQGVSKEQLADLLMTEELAV